MEVREDERDNLHVLLLMQIKIDDYKLSYNLYINININI